MKIFVTGGAGFIGSAFIRYVINNSSDSIVNFDKLTYAGNLDSLELVEDSDHYSFIHGDICNENDLEAAIFSTSPDCIIHLAAESHVDRSIDNPLNFIESNIIGTFNLLEATRAYWEKIGDIKKNLLCLDIISINW